MLFFKSKAKKEEERKEKAWNDLAARAIRQLKSSMFDVGQVQRFCSFMGARRYSPNGFAILQDLTEAKLFDGTPLLSKFFIYSSSYERECSVGIHNGAIVAFAARNELHRAFAASRFQQLFETVDQVAEIVFLRYGIGLLAVGDKGREAA